MAGAGVYGRHSMNVPEAVEPDFRRRDLLQVAGPVGLALVARGLYWAFVTPDWRPIADTDQYIRIARYLAAGEGYTLVFPGLEEHATAFRPPLYPTLLAIPTAVFGGEVLWPVRLFTLLVGLVVVGLVVVYTRRIAGPLAGVVAGSVVALFPPLIANDTVTLTEPLALALVLGILLLLLDGRWVWVGVLGGFLLLTRPNAYLVPVVAGIALWRPVGWRRALGSVLVAALVVIPWSLRNKVQVGTFSLTTSEGFNIAAVYAPPAQERGGFADPVYDDWYDGTDYQLWQFEEARWNTELRALGFRSIRADPGYVITVVRRNVQSLVELGGLDVEEAEQLDGRNPDFRHAMLPLFWLVLLIGGFGLAVRARDRRVWPAYAVVGQFVVLSLLLIAVPRHRAPVDLLLCIGVGFAAAWFAERSVRRRAARESLRGSGDDAVGAQGGELGVAEAELG